MAKLDDITACFPSISDWEDSYLANKDQRLLGVNDEIKVEILLKGGPKSVSFLLDGVTKEVLNCLVLLTGDLAGSLNFLADGAKFGAENPNTEYRRQIGGAELTWTWIRSKTAGTHLLSIRLPDDPPEKQPPKK